MSVMDLVAAVRHAYECFLAGDPGPMAVLLADDVTYHLPGGHLGGGVLRGRQAVFQRMAEAAPRFDEPPRIQLHAVTSVGQFVVTLERFSARRAGNLLDQDVLVVWRMQGDRCAELWAHFSDQAACDAFWDDSGVK